MSLILDGTAGVTFPSGSGTQAAQSKVLQVVQGTTSTSVTSANSTWVATNLTASITPLFSTSKILVFGQIFISASVSACQPNITLYKASASVISNSYGFGDFYSSAGGYSEIILPFSYLDSPATTSSTTYTIYGRNPSSTGSSQFADSNRISVITLMEIAV